MKTLTNENDISQLLNTDIILYFYRSDDILLYDMMQPILTELNKSNEIVGIDITAFISTIKRFTIQEVPTILFFQDGAERKRISGIPKNLI
jgi:thiol-disulfide isomerase/thioredoxin